MGFLFKKKNDNNVNEEKSSSFLKYAIPIGLGLLAKSKSNKKKASRNVETGEKVLGGLFRKKVSDDDKVLGGLFRKTGNGIFKKK